MGHIDHPHQTESDRQAEAHHQQNRGEAETVEHIAQDIAQPQIALDRRDRLLHGLLNYRYLLLGRLRFLSRARGRFGTGRREGSTA